MKTKHWILIIVLYLTWRYWPKPKALAGATNAFVGSGTSSGSGVLSYAIRDEFNEVMLNMSNMQKTLYKDVELQTYADLTHYKFTVQPTIFTIIDDEDKGLSDTVYFWKGSGKIQWIPGTENDDFQPVL